MDKKEFMLQYILTRTSHKKTVNQLLADAETAWNYISSF